jgi:hypothetical protein
MMDRSEEAYQTWWAMRLHPASREIPNFRLLDLVAAGMGLPEPFVWAAVRSRLLGDDTTAQSDQAHDTLTTQQEDRTYEPTA